MNDEIKTEDIIKSLLICTDFIKSCSECAFNNLMEPNCRFAMGNAAVDQLKQLSNQHIKIQYCSEELTISEMCGRMDGLRKKVNAARLENELLKNHIEGKCVIAQYAEGAPAADQPNHFVDTSEKAPDDERIMRQAIETYGVQAQCDVAIEEMAELTKAIVKIRRVADDYGKTQAALDNLMEEIADVDIMIDQLKIMWGPKQVEEYRKKKLERLERRLNDDRN